MLDVLIASYNRARCLETAVRSVLRSADRAGADVQVTVVDNNSTDSTRQIAERLREEHEPRVQYLFEVRQGKSWALNAAIEATSGELVAFVDDDEEVDETWVSTVVETFRDPTVDFAGGSTLPRWSSPPPSWLPSNLRAAVGWVEVEGTAVREYGRDHDGVLMGGNSIVRRRVLNRLGPAPFPTYLGRKGKQLLTADDVFFQKLLELGVRGVCVPSLVVRHYVFPHMLTRQYHRRWCFWNAASAGIRSRTKPDPVIHLLGVPRWQIRKAIEGAFGAVWWRLTNPARSFERQLAVIHVAGYAFGRYWLRVDRESAKAEATPAKTLVRAQSAGQSDRL